MLNKTDEPPCRPLVLIVDDNPQNIQVLGATLSQHDYSVSVAASGQEALERLRESKPDLILLDVMMPGINGFETCREIKKNTQHAEIPIIFLTAKVAEEDVVAGFEAGGVDYVTKPFRKVELLARVQTHVALRRSYQELAAAKERLEIMANTDSLTELSNRRHMRSTIEKEISRTSRSGGAFSLILADIDHFKAVNDTYGHDMGDYVLQRTSELLSSTLRNEDTAARWGGEEFLFLLPETIEAGACTVAEKARKTIADAEFIFKEKKLQVTMSFGVSEFAVLQSMDECVCCADSALYKGKEDGRNRVIAFSEL